MMVFDASTIVSGQKYHAIAPNETVVSPKISPKTNAAGSTVVAVRAKFEVLHIIVGWQTE